SEDAGMLRSEGGGASSSAIPASVSSSRKQRGARRSGAKRARNVARVEHDRGRAHHVRRDRVERILDAKRAADEAELGVAERGRVFEEAGLGELRDVVLALERTDG